MAKVTSKESKSTDVSAIKSELLDDFRYSYGGFELPQQSIEISGIGSRMQNIIGDGADQALPPEFRGFWLRNFHASVTLPLGDKKSADIRVHMKLKTHNCSCHKIAALCFFQWTPGGKYEQVPLINGFPETKHLIIGEVTEVQKRD